ncbi:hypothetical protein [uncultured Acinetobacter sp.]|uniref:hypothetical protein n=1 Tax=uncultured Acinetobacter sp. TaxID=165433 RepID=UPI0025CCD640|nr:hypothetical protein [uncultured Acinetobacter sp.]
MTLLIALQLDEYIFLASDQRVTVQCEAFTGLPPLLYVDDFKKYRIWDYGVMICSGNVTFLEYFYSLIKLKKSYSEDAMQDFSKMATTAKELCLAGHGIQFDQSTATIFITARIKGKFELIQLNIRENYFEYFVIEPMSIVLSMFAGVPDDPAYQVVVDALRPISAFKNYQGFYEYHVQLIDLFFKRQCSFDESITSQYDVIVQNTRFGNGSIVEITGNEPLLSSRSYLSAE